MALPKRVPRCFCRREGRGVQAAVHQGIYPLLANALVLSKAAFENEALRHADCDGLGSYVEGLQKQTMHAQYIEPYALDETEKMSVVGTEFTVVYSLGIQ